MEPILVTGAARGLGRSLVEELAGRGHEVIATSRSGEDLRGLRSGVQTLRMDVNRGYSGGGEGVAAQASPRTPTSRLVVVTAIVGPFRELGEIASR